MGVKTFAQRLSYARSKQGYTQDKLASLCGVSQSTIASYESGTRLHTRHLLTLAKCLKVNPLWLDKGIGHMSLTLQETDKNYSTFWPFARVSPDELNELSEQDRDLIENLLYALIQRLRG